MRGRRHNDLPPRGPTSRADIGWRHTVTDHRSSDEDLLQGRLDGALSAEESARLDVRLTESGALRLRAAQLAAARSPATP